ncbi:MAG: hypothetical protein F6K62_06155 [Sphaerospermopsis sp. SIO1G2]|nr:hypothetical protein [Sphaerospermopsis sp. SIO1G2]
MAQLELTDLFPNASQTSLSITIPKSDLGLTLATNDADHFVAAVAIKAKEYMTQEQYDNNFEQRVYCTDGFSQFPVKNDGTNDIQFISRQIVINLVEPDEPTFNPENY